MPTYVKVRRIPKTRQDEARVWDVVKWTTGIAFYVVWAAGIIDALVHHNAEVITVTHEKPGGPSSRRETDVANPGVALSRTRAPDAEPRLFLFPTTGGIGAGVAYEF
jgi:hypothetical protein